MNDQIQSVKPDIVFIDSLTRVYSGVIEESAVAKRVTERLSTLAKKNNITMIIIHHTPKDKDAAISIESLAGSRVLSQEADFMIGINKFSNGNRYMKEVACRYKRESEKVIPFEISEDLIIKHHDPVDEMKLLVGLDRRTDTTNRDLIHRYIQRASAVHGMVDIRILQNKFVDNGRMGKQTLFDNLKKLFNEGKIGQEKKGEYFAIIE